MAAEDSSKKPDVVRKACLRMSAADYKRLGILRTKGDLTWDALLAQAVNLWLVAHDEKELSGS